MKQLSIRFFKRPELEERLKASAERNGRSLNMQVLQFVEEGLLLDEEFHSLPKEKKLLVLQATREIIEKLAN